jgi:signal peptidase I|uniref:Signal peptidase I n=1 Tax=uncultured Aquificaceae bacterium TaxID=374108 RepID=A0A146JAQ8_9AQUI|nr:putative signal peptidase I [uncultured Aquificaceae bacterium]
MERVENKQDKEKKNTTNIKHIIETVVFIFIVVSLVRVFLVQAFNIPSGSMKPSLLVGDFILVNKLVYGNWDIGIPFTNITFFHHNNRLAKIDRGDVIVFKYPEDPSIDFIKRVVGLPGDIVEVKNDIVYINGKPLKRVEDGYYEEENEKVKKYKETTIRSDGKEYSYTVMEIEDGIGPDFGPVQVPPNSYFVMGDNRDNSKDSRFWGFVPDDYVVGQAFVIYFSINLKKPSIRFERLGKVIY